MSRHATAGAANPHNPPGMTSEAGRALRETQLARLVKLALLSAPFRRRAHDVMVARRAAAAVMAILSLVRAVKLITKR